MTCDDLTYDKQTDGHINGKVQVNQNTREQDNFVLMSFYLYFLFISESVCNYWISSDLGIALKHISSLYVNLHGLFTVGSIIFLFVIQWFDGQSI